MMAEEKEEYPVESHPMLAGLNNFSCALYWLKRGHRVYRKGWNGKDMWLKLVHGQQAGVDELDYIVREDSIGEDHISALRLLPWIGMKTADNGFVPWLASQTDLLADDWGFSQ